MSRLFNLLVSASADSWDGKPFVLELDRCLSFTAKELVAKYGAFDGKALKTLRRLPAVFAYEVDCKKAPKFGRIRDVHKVGGSATITYELIEVVPFLTADTLNSLKVSLDIDRLELYRTHWALKNVDLGLVLKECNVRLPAWITSGGSGRVDVETHRFSVGFSFAGENRELVSNVAEEIERQLGPDACFYDEDYKAQLAQPNLDTLLQRIYRDHCDLLVVFLCGKYQDKMWCGIEWRAIREVLNSKESSRIMFVKIDDAVINGVATHDGYIDARTHSAEEIAELICKRLDILRRKAEESY